MIFEFQMKRLVAAFACALLLCSSAQAKPVDAGTARRVAETYMRAMGMINTAALVDVTAQTPFAEFYVFTAPKGGFILISADDCVKPVLGYSTGNRFETKDIPEPVAEWLRDYENEIRHVKHLKSWTRHAEWSMLEAGEIPSMMSKSMTDTLTTKWSQGRYYNLLCPSDTNHSSGHALTGCVATSMGMVMKYWNFPTTGFSNHGYTHSSYGWQYADFDATTYQWDNMPAQLTSVTSDAQDSAVALLLYHVGVSVEMGYGSSSSGAQTVNGGSFTKASQENALIRYFKYSPALHSVNRDDFAPSEWNALLAAEIDAGRPVVYSGHGSGGHAFVLDGYNNDGCFHFNWGWSGSYNGYYPIGGLNPTSTRYYNSSNRANIGIQPNLDWGTGGTITVNTSDSTRGTVSPSVAYNFGDTVFIRAYPNHGYRFKCWSDGSPYISRGIYGTGGDYSFTAVFVPVGTDTLELYGGRYKMTSYGRPSAGDYSWGVKFDASYMQLGRELHAVELYVNGDGDYDMYVYLGSDNGRYLMFDTTFTVDSTEVDQWKTVSLHTPVVVDGWESMWVIFHKTGTGYPACVTTYSGINESFVSVSGNDFNEVGESRGYSTMIRGLFRPTDSLPMPRVYANGSEQVAVGGTATFTATGTPGATVNWTFPGGTPDTATGYEVNTVYNTAGIHQAIASITLGSITVSDTVSLLAVDYAAGDTVSYCMDRPMINTGGTGDSTTWGIMLPAAYLHGRNYLNDVLLYVEHEGDYTLHVYQGGSSSPGAEIYTKTFSFDANATGGYRSCRPDSPVRIDTMQNLWIVFGSSVAFPAAHCNYMGEPNSDWIQDDGWVQIHDAYPNLSWAWLIKAVTSQTRAEYTVTVNRVCYECNDYISASLIEGEGSYLDGDTVTLKAWSNGCYMTFFFWITEMGDTLDDATYTFVIHSDCTLSAFFCPSGSIDDVGESAISLYPNPATDKVTLTMAEQGEVNVIDVAGRLVMKQWVVVGDNTLDVSTLPNGLYYLKMGSHHSSFIVNH